MSRTIHLNDEQRVLLEKHKEEWFKINTDTHRANREKAESLIKDIYVYNDAEQEPIFFWCESPWECILKIDYLSSLDNPSLYDEKFFKENYNERDAVDVYIKNYLGGQSDVQWPALYTFCKMIDPEFKDEDEEIIDKWVELCKEVNWWFPYKDCCVISDKLQQIHYDRERDMLHNENGPAIGFSDGFGIYYLNGVRVPDWIVETPAEKLSATDFAKIDNVEVRREFVRKVGIDRLMKDLEKELLDISGDYKLYRINLGKIEGDSEPIYGTYLQMTNPSTKDIHLECVHENCKNVDEAIRWRNRELDFEGDETFMQEENIQLT